MDIDEGIMKLVAERVSAAMRAQEEVLFRGLLDPRSEVESARLRSIFDAPPPAPLIDPELERHWRETITIDLYYDVKESAAEGHPVYVTSPVRL